jgi:hypothetical protein
VIGNSVLFIDSGTNQTELKEIFYRCYIKDCKYGDAFQISNLEAMTDDESEYYPGNYHLVSIPWDKIGSNSVHVRDQSFCYNYICI